MKIRQAARSVGRFFAQRRDLGRWSYAWAVSLGVWIALDVVVQIQSAVYYHEKSLPIPWARFFADYCDSVVWAFFTPFIILLTSWYAISRQTWRQTVPVHLVAGIVAGLLWLPVMQEVRIVFSVFFDEPTMVWPETPGMVFRVLIEALLLYTQAAAVSHGMHFYREYRDRDLSASRLQAQLAEAQLSILRMQLHPHFLFNTLNTISALVHRDAKAADRMLALLGDLLRDSFEKIGAQEVALKQEMEFLERYLDIEKTRFQDRLVIETHVAPETLDALVPNLILQPLVENSIRHGIGRRSGNGRIEVRSWRENGMLAVRVRDDGPGIPEDVDARLRQGVGLANTQARLQQLYGSRHRFDLTNRPEGGLDVTLTVPFRPADVDVLAAGGV